MAKLKLSSRSRPIVLGKVPLTARFMLHDSLTARRAAGIIALFTVAVTVVGGIPGAGGRPSGVPDDRQGPVARAADRHDRGVWRRHAEAAQRSVHRRRRDAGRDRLPRGDHRGGHRLAGREQSATLRRPVGVGRYPAARSDRPTIGEDRSRTRSTRRLGGHPMAPADEPGSITAGNERRAARVDAGGRAGPPQPHPANVLRVA